MSADNGTEKTAPPRRLTPTERAHEIMLAALHRTPVKASEEVEINRSTANGEYGWRVAGVTGEEETLEKTALRVLSVARSLDDELPLSRAMHYKRDYLPNEKDAVKRGAK